MFDVSLTPEATSVLLVVVYLLGVGARIVWPYAVAYLTKPQSFVWEKAKGQMISAAVGLVTVILSGMIEPGFVETLGAAGWVGAFVAGYGAAAVGRQAKKTLDLRNK